MKLKTVWQALRGILLGLACASLPVLAGAQTLQELKTSAEAGDAAAQVKMGERHFYGEGGAPNDNAEALRWFLMAAEQGSRAGQSWAGSLYKGTVGVPRDLEKAKFWWNKAIAQGSDAAAYNLSNLYKDEKNYPEALRLMKLYGELAGDELYEEDRRYLAQDVAELENLVATGGAPASVVKLGPEPSPPGLLPGEFLQSTSNGCKIVSWLPDTVPDAVKTQAEQAKVEWSGGCLHGRAHGKGKLYLHFDAEFAYGHWMGAPVAGFDARGEAAFGGTHYFLPGIGNAAVGSPSPGTPFKPAWPVAPGQFTGSTMFLYDRVNGNYSTVYLARIKCHAYMKDQMSAAQKRSLAGKRCRGDDGDVLVHYVESARGPLNAQGGTELSGAHALQITSHYCPDPTKSSGCDEVWDREIAGVLPQISLLTEVATKVAERTEIRDAAIAGYRDFETRLAQWNEEKRRAEAAAADLARRQQAERDAAARIELEQAAETARLEVEAMQEAARKALTDSLKTLNPGQMLAKADELEQEGRIEDARTVRRELLSRFPDHPLAIVAAEKLTAAPRPPAGPPGPEAEFAALRERADRGDVSAQMELASAHYSGKGIKKDKAEAARWYRVAANQGNADAQNHLGNMLYAGDGIPKDATEATLYYRLAADQGHPSAQSNLGNAYAYGNGVEKSLSEAAHWYQIAAKQGYAPAQTSLGILNWNGDGVAQNALEASRWFQAAAEQGDAMAQNFLGVMLYEGKDIPRDFVRAARYFRLAADQGLSAAQNNLGNAYRHGNGVNKDTAAAMAWFRAASNQGYELAGKNLAALEKQLAEEVGQQRLAEQRAEAQRAQAQQAEQQRQRQQEADAKAWGMLAAGGLTAALGGNTEDVLGAMTGQPVARPQSSSRSGPSSSSISCSGQNRTASCLMEECRQWASEGEKRNPDSKFECKLGKDSRGVDCVTQISPHQFGVRCVDGFGVAK